MRPHNQIPFTGKTQPKSTFFEAAVPPGKTSALQLPGGKTEPYYYCLGVDSTVPFVSFQGGGSSQKIFSWGEMIEVLPGQTVTVKNESFMQGDICIQSGHDYGAKPERISTAVVLSDPFIDPAFPGYNAVSSKYPADTRRCRRAYLKFQVNTTVDPFLIKITGKPIKHSFTGTDSFTGQRTYTEFFTLTPFTAGGIAPLGYSSLQSPGLVDFLGPMALTDQVSVTIYSSIANPPISLNTLYMYVLEY